MQIIEKESIQKEVIYVANDGREFKCKADLVKYQFTLLLQQDFSDYQHEKVHTVPIIVDDYASYKPCAYINSAADYYDFVAYLCKENTDNCRISYELRRHAALRSFAENNIDEYIEKQYAGHWIAFHGDDRSDSYNFDFYRLDELVNEYSADIDMRKVALTSMARFVDVPACYVEGRDEEVSEDASK